MRNAIHIPAIILSFLLSVCAASAVAQSPPQEDTAAYQSKSGGEHFLVSNEMELGRFAADLVKRQGGGYLGVGAEQNYTLMAYAQPDRAYLVDTDPAVIEMHQAYFALHRLAENRAEFLAYLAGRWPPKGDFSGTSLRPLVNAVEGEPEMDVDAFLESVKPQLRTQEFEALAALLGRPELHRSPELARLLADARFDIQREIQFAGDSLLDPSDAGRKAAWLSDEQGYARVRQLILQNRVKLAVGSISGPRTMRGIAEQARASKLEFRNVYISNADIYVAGAGEYQALLRNLRALPGEHPRVLRTTINLKRTPGLDPWTYRSESVAELTAFGRQIGNGDPFLSAIAALGPGLSAPKRPVLFDEVPAQGINRVLGTVTERMGQQKTSPPPAGEGRRKAEREAARRPKGR